MQRFEILRESLVNAFLEKKKSNPEAFKNRLNLSWSNWGFGLESLEVSCERLNKNGLKFIELHGNHYGDDLGYDTEETRIILNDFNLKLSGVCGMFSNENDFSSNIPICQQRAIDYVKREVKFVKDLEGHYLLLVPGAVGRPEAYDEYEFERASMSMRKIGNVLVESDIKGAIEPIRSAEVSLVRTVNDAIELINAVNHPGIQHINGDVYHMQSEESNIADAILRAGDRLINLHMADSNRLALGKGSMDLDAIIMALYVIGHNVPGRFVSPEPLGPGAGPYPARNGLQDPKRLDSLVSDTINYFREREEAVLSL